MPSLSTFTLDPALFNPGLYTSVLRLLLPTYPTLSSTVSQATIRRWFSSSADFDAECNAIAGRALASIGPDKLILPTFVSVEADRALYSDLSRPFLSQLETSLSAQITGANATTTTKAVATTNTNATGSLASPPYVALALSLLLDQLPRNLNRGPLQSLIYTHYDRLSIALCHHLLSLSLDASFSLHPPWQLWFYMPLEHSESIANHEVLRARMRTMLERAKERGDGDGAKFVEGAMGFEQRHWTPLERFGRYPWRNRWVGRQGTEEEEKWLEEGGDRFGTG